MPIEAPVNYIEDLNEAWPAGPEDSGDGDNHLVNIKTAIKGSFPNLGQAPVTKTAAEINKTVDVQIPVGGIIMYTGPVATIPANWQLCDGASPTPDLRGKFVLGATDDTDAGDTGGSADAVVVNHGHANDLSVDLGGEHSHTITTGTGDTGTGNAILDRSDATSTAEAVGFIGTEADHVHGLSGGVTDTGVSGTGANMPPYYTLAYIMRVT